MMSGLASGSGREVKTNRREFCWAEVGGGGICVFGFLFNSAV